MANGLSMDTQVVHGGYKMFQKIMLMYLTLLISAEEKIPH